MAAKAIPAFPFVASTIKSPGLLLHFDSSCKIIVFAFNIDISGTLFNSQNGLQVFALASFFDQSHPAVVAGAAKDGSKFFNWRMAINDFTKNDK